MSSLDLIKKHEGLRLKVYKDSLGIETIGYGRNLVDVGITENMAQDMLMEDMLAVYRECNKYHWYHGLNPARRAVIENMMFNMGASRFAGFEKTIGYIENGQWYKASTEMLDSKWAVQVGNRAQELSMLMETGEFRD